MDVCLSDYQHEHSGIMLPSGSHTNVPQSLHHTRLALVGVFRQQWFVIVQQQCVCNGAVSFLIAVCRLMHPAEQETVASALRFVKSLPLRASRCTQPMVAESTFVFLHYIASFFSSA